MERLRRLISSDIPFARDDAHRMLPAMIACLVGFVALLLAVAVSLSDALSSQAHDMVGVLQVEVPRAKAADARLLDTITNTIQRTPGVEKVTLLGPADMEELLKPWLGKDFSLDDLPVPVILDVQTAVKGQKSAVNLAALRADLVRIDGGIRVEDRGPWVAQMAQAATFVQMLVIVIALLLMACVAGMIVLVSRTNLKLHFKAVSLLHMFGATDEYILRQFQWNSAWLAMRGALAGVLFAALVFATAVIMSVRWHSPVFPEVHMGLLHGLTFVALPVLTALVAMLATRLTVRSMLHHMR